MLRYIIILISFILSLHTSAQDTLMLNEVEMISTLQMDAKGNFYVADNNFSLLKYDPSGKLITNVNIKSYGNISSIDCSNPFEIYVYYQDQNIIVFYDNMLNFRGEVRLNDYFFNNVTCVARSFDNHIWLVDLSEYKLLKINKQGKILIETPYLNNILNNEIHPYKIWEYNNALYLADSVIGVYQFDLFASYASTFYFEGAKDVCQSNGLFYFLKDKNIFGYRQLTREPIKLPYKVPANTSLCFANNKLFTFLRNKIISYPAEL